MAVRLFRSHCCQCCLTHNAWRCAGFKLSKHAYHNTYPGLWVGWVLDRLMCTDLCSVSSTLWLCSRDQCCYREECTVAARALLLFGCMWIRQASQQCAEPSAVGLRRFPFWLRASLFTVWWCDWCRGGVVAVGSEVVSPLIRQSQHVASGLLDLSLRSDQAELAGSQ